MVSDKRRGWRERGKETETERRETQRGSSGRSGSGGESVAKLPTRSWAMIYCTLFDIQWVNVKKRAPYDSMCEADIRLNLP